MNLLDPAKTRFDEDELTTLLQILFVWLVEKKYHSIYMNKMIRLVNILMEPRHCKTLVNVLIKLNTISIFSTIYYKVELNDVYQSQLLADQIILFTRVFVNKLSELMKTTKDKDLLGVFANMVTWTELQAEIK